MSIFITSITGLNKHFRKQSIKVGEAGASSGPPLAMTLNRINIISKCYHYTSYKDGFAEPVTIVYGYQIITISIILYLCGLPGYLLMTKLMC